MIKQVVSEAELARREYEILLSQKKLRKTVNRFRLAAYIIAGISLLVFYFFRRISV